MNTFTWLPDQNPEYTVDMGVRTVQFGLGITQLQSTLLARPMHKVSLVFSRNPKVIAEIYAFLLAQQGKRFVWQRPDKSLMTVYCTELSITETGIATGTDVLKATFQEIVA